MATAKKKAPAKQAPAKKAAPAKQASAKKETSKPKGLRDPIGDALTRAERAKYGPYVVGNETNYTPGDSSKTLRAYSRVTGYIPRSSGSGPSRGSSGNMGRGNIGGGLRKQGK